MSTTPELPTVITPALARMYLDNVAAALVNHVLPALEGGARDRANDCLRIVTRLATDAQLSDATRALLPNAANDALTQALSAAAAHANTEAEAAAHQHAMRAGNPATARSLDVDALQAWLRAHPRGGPAVRITASRLAAGGRSKITALVSQQGAVDLPELLVLRQDWARSVTGKAVAIEFDMLQRLHDEGVRVPQPLLIEREVTAVGNPFMLVTRHPGAPCGDHFKVLPPTERPVLQLAENIGRCHRIGAAPFAGMEGIVESNFTAAQLRASITAFGATIAQHDVARSPLIDAVIDWLERNAERVAEGAPRVLVHADIGFHNALVNGDELSVILDWEMAHIGNPAYDLGYLRHAVDDDAFWSRVMAHYHAAGGPSFDPRAVDYYNLFTGLWYHQIQLQARAWLLSGAVREIEIAALNADFAPQIVAGMGAALKRLTER